MTTMLNGPRKTSPRLSAPVGPTLMAGNNKGARATWGLGDGRIAVSREIAEIELLDFKEASKWESTLTTRKGWS
jgi:hypothetical protein